MKVCLIGKKSKIIAVFICIILVSSLVYIPQDSAYATQNRMDNYSKAFSLCGNGADDIVSVAKAQIEKTGSHLGYSEEWCADFVSDCAALANQGSAIPRNGYCPSLQTAILNAGGQSVPISSARKGDIAFYGTNGASHVEIIYANNGGRISTIGGNSGNWSDCYSRRVRDHSYQTMTITKVLRPNYGSKTPVLPGTIDSGWKVPANVAASHRITTYDQWANAESNHYIDPGDNCYITEVYTNGFVKVQYPIPGGKRWAYAKASDFSLEPTSKLPDTRLQAWFSTSAMGGTANSIRLNDLVYLCYRLETQDGKLLDGSIGNYTVKETIFFPDGSTVPYSYAKSNNNWIRSNFTQWGTYRGVVEISGDYTGKVEVSYTISKPKEILLSSWFSLSKMGSEVSSMEKGKFYYLCYSIKADNDYLNKIANCEYSVTEEVYGPDGKKVHTYTYDKSDNNWIGFTATQSGTYKGIVTIKGHPSGSDTTTCVCKDTSTPTLKSIDIVQYPKLDYEIGTALDLRGMVVKAYYSNKTYKTITNYRVDGDITKVGHPVITISYTEGGITKTAQFTVNVKEKTPQTVTITYSSSGGNWEQKQQQVKKGEKTTLLSGTPGKKYKVTLDANGGVLSQTSLSADVPFLGWYTQKGGKGQRYSPGECVSFEQNVTLYAAYGSAKIGTLPVPSRNACEFDGWYMANGTKVSSNTMISDDCTLTAKWQLKEPVHQPGEWIVVQMPTNTSQGKKVKKCQDCGLILATEIIPMLQEDDNNGQIDDQDPEEPDDNDEDVETVAVGDEITTDEAIYTVTKLGNTPCVEYSELFDDEVTKEVIPDTITVDGVTYLVTSVAPKAFYKNTGVKQVTIGKNVTEIGSKAFYGCSSLNRLIIKSDKIKSGSIGSNAFAKVAKNVKVYVPETKYSTYKKILKKAGIGSKAKIYKKK